MVKSAGVIKLRLLRNISLLILGCAGSLLLRGLFSSCGEQGLLSSYSARTHRSSSFGCRALAPGAGSSVLAAQGLGCSAACGIFPDQGSSPRLRYWQIDSLLLSHQESLN